MSAFYPYKKTRIPPNICYTGGQTVTVNNGIHFTGNNAAAPNGIGGAIINFHGNSLIIGNNVSFDGNQAGDAGGAIWSEGVYSFGSEVSPHGAASLTVGNGVSFTDNGATGDMAGAVGIMGQQDANFGDNVTFDRNTAGNRGGAVGLQSANWGISDDGPVNANFGKNAIFTNNSAGNGGAVWNRSRDYEGNISQGSTVTFDTGALFENNRATAGNGGAVYNHYQGTTENSTARMTFADGAVFKNNTASGQGGAIFNENGVLTFGNVTFTGNTANNSANDIHNTGTINFNGDVTLDGEENVTVANNPIYNLTLTEQGKINVSVKSGSQIIESIDAPVTAQEASTISAIVATNGNGTGTANAIADRISEALQNGNSAAAVEAVKELAPTTSQQVMGVAQGVNSVLSNVAGGRMAAVGKSGGDTFVGGSLWAQGLYNHTKQNTTGNAAGFSADTNGVAFGIDGKLNDAVTIGIGYGYTQTDADSLGRSVDVDGNTFFVYGQYQPDQFYVNAMLSYGVSKYTEEKAPMGIVMKAKYDVDTYAANLMTGYDFANGITPEGGFRYVLAKQESYEDGAQRISTDDSDVLTAVIGVKYTAETKAGDLTITPSLRLAVTYDLVSDNSKANIDIIGGGNYQIVGDRLHRLGAETGVGISASIKDWDLTLEYNGGFRKDYQTHTGLLKATYHF